METDQHCHSKSRKFAELLDSRFTLPGTKIKIGIDPIIGLVSGIGDLAGASLSLYFMFMATKKGAGVSILLRMFVNILADLAIGTIPVLGDMFDIAWKANLRNARLLEKLEKNPEQTEKSSSILIWLLFALLTMILFGVILLIGWIVAEAWNILFN